MNTDLAIVVLAAGEGSRMRSALPKVLHPICGRPLVRLVLDAADQLGASRTVVMLNPAIIGRVSAALGPGYEYTLQEQQLGTGHALLQARSLLRGKSERVLVLYGDTPLLRAATVQALCDQQARAGAVAALLSFHTPQPTGYGRVLRDAQRQVLRLVEERNATPEQRALSECNSGIYCFAAEWLWEYIDQIALNSLKGEYYLTDMIEMAVAQRGPGAAVALAAADASEAFGVNDRAQLAEAEAALRARVLHGLMLRGVTVVDPASTYVDVGVSVGGDTTLLPGTLLQGNTTVGERCVIGPHTQLSNTTVGNDARVSFSVVVNSTVSVGQHVGPFVQIRAKREG